MNNLSSQISNLATDKQNIMKVYYGTHTTGDIIGNASSITGILYPSGIPKSKIKLVLPFMPSPYTAWDTYGLIENVTLETSGIKITVHTFGTRTQSYGIKYYILYED